MAKQDYLPDREGDLVTWLKNFKTKVAVHGKTLGLTQPEIDTLVQKSDAAIAEIEKTGQMKNDAKQQTARKNQVKTDALNQIRADVNRMKADPDYSEEIGKDMDVIGSDEGFAPDTYKTELKVAVFPGHVRIDFTKKGVDGLNIYSRSQGESQWTFLARDTRSPYIDNRPLAQANTPETREYMAIGVIDDDEIGLMSDVVNAVFGG